MGKRARSTSSDGNSTGKSRNELFPIVGIGASAGGLEAFTALLKALPVDTGMGFVLVQHVDPKRESLLSQLLSRATGMAVSQVADRTRVEPNRVYVIPPNKDLTIDQGVLRLTNLRSERKPIDNFFLGLAKDRQDKAIGIILSGTGSDGTLGLKAIKAAGGITFAQDPKSAKYTGMPMSAAASGYADFVLSPQPIAHQIQWLARHSGAAESEPAPELPDESKALRRIFRLLRTVTDVDFSLYKLKTIKRRIQRRMILREISDFDRYVRHLQNNPSEVRDLFEDILIPVTAFFREPEAFQALQSDVFPRIAAIAKKTRSIRVWVPGCSTGEEVYSIAISLLEYLGGQAARLKIQLFGTDLSERVIQVARNGLYAESSVENISRDRLRRFFVKTEGGYQVAKSIREICIFARQDLAKDPPFARLDLISCQNVFIYLGTALQKRTMAVFHYALKPTGYLVLGKSEAPLAYADFFSLEDRKNKIFSRKPLPARRLQTMPALSFDKTHLQEPASAESATLSLVEEGRRILLEHYSAPGFIVDSNLNILHFQGDTSPFLKPSTGAASFHLLKMLRPEFAVELRSLVHKARKESVPVRRGAIEIEHGGHANRVVMEVVPLHAANSTASNFMVLFPKMELAPRLNLKEQPGGKTPGGRREIAVLHRELATARESLKAIAEDQEAVNEELKTANEEILSSNEELQSTNEELETAKEELQSANEELATLNEELQNRNAELSTFGDDLSSLLTGANIPILILDNSRKIRRFTPATQRIFNLIPSDIGRPFGDISSTLEAPDWDELISRVIDQLQTVEQDVSDRNGRWYSLRMRPYKTSENKIDGVLMALLDVDQLKRQLSRTEEALKTTQELYRLMAENTRDFVALHSADSKYIYVSPSGERLFGYSQGEMVGKPPLPFCHPDDRKNVELAFKKASRSRSTSQITYRALTKDGRELWLEALITAIVDDKGKVTRLQTSSRDVTERKKSGDRLRESESTIRTLLETASQGIFAVNPGGRIVMANRMAEDMFGYRKAELLETFIDNLIPQQARARHSRKHKHFFLEPKTRQMGIGLNLFGRRKNGKEFPVEVNLSHIETNQHMLAVAFVTDISERKQAEAALLDSHDKLRVLTGRLMSVQDEESKRISRELHDAFSQELAALATASRLLRRELPPQARTTAKKIEGVAQRIGKLATDINQMSRRLHPAILDDLGLSAALKAACQAFSQLQGIRTDFTSSRVPKFVPENVALCLYRVAQESLQNAAKHSGTGKARVALASNRGEIQLTVQDFGSGFDFRAQKRKKGGLGLISMEERVRFVGGTLTVDSKRGKGTTVQARVPLKVKMP